MDHPIARIAAALAPTLNEQAHSRKYVLADDAKYFAPLHYDASEDSTAVILRQLVERAIVRCLVVTILDCASNYSVSVFDGAETALSKSRNIDEIMGAIMSTDMDSLNLHEGTRYVGFVSLVYGNDGWDVIADNSDTPEVNRVVADAEVLAGALCEHLA